MQLLCVIASSSVCVAQEELAGGVMRDRAREEARAARGERDGVELEQVRCILGWEW